MHFSKRSNCFNLQLNMFVKTIQVVFGVIIITSVTMYLCLYGNESSCRRNAGKQSTATHSSETKNKQTKYILFWMKMFTSKDFYFGQSEFKLFENCEYSNCYATDNERFLPVERFDALLFHGVEYDPLKHRVPAKRTVKQRYMFVDLESPIYSGVAYKKTSSNFYNWTMTYRNDSDIMRPYGVIVSNETGYVFPTAKALRRKPKLVAWIVSRCKSQSKRDQYVKLLESYVPVDIYGKCGPFKCPKTNEEACSRNIERNYKFYLSFENSLCRDYITEKLYNILKYNVVPIVNGFREDYEKLAPPNSYIHIDDYPNPANLAMYLLHLDMNNTEYLKYFEWKKKYVSDRAIAAQRAACELCRKLHNPDEPPKVYKNIYEWWWGKNEEMCKVPPKWSTEAN